MIQNPQFFKVSLKAIIKNKMDEYLILKASSNRWFKGFWDLPGGRINKDEININFHKLIDREIKEEAGTSVKYKLRLDPVSLSKYKFPNGACTLYILFEAKYISGKIEISEEHSEYQWQKLNKQNVKKLFHGSLKELMFNYFDWNNKN
jgi:8-oxo-dGTP pyrophosphatase MutT (NUDIX family)